MTILVDSIVKTQQVQIQTAAAAHKRHNTRQQPFNITDSSLHLHLHEPAVPAEPEDV